MEQLGKLVGPAHRTYTSEIEEGRSRTIIDRPTLERVPILSRIASWLPFRTKPEPTAEEEEAPTVRIVDRDGYYKQSKGKVVIQRKIPRGDFIALYSRDWFHSLLDAPTSRIVLLLTINYLIVTVIFAIFYYVVSIVYGCNMDIRNFHEAFVFSVETFATLGYGTKDIFFGDCVVSALILSCQVIISLFTDALIIGVIYHRVSRPQTRASTIVFSSKGTCVHQSH